MTALERNTNTGPGVVRRPPSLSAASAAPVTLVQTLQAAARAMDNPRLRAQSELAMACQPRMLLTLLAYCYSVEIYGSAEIEALLQRDTNLRPLCREQFLDAPMIRRFRRENRESLQACLEAALRFMAEQKVAQGMITRVNGARIAEEARRRIITAMFTDSMELDKDHGTDTPVDLCYLVANGHSATH